MSKLVGRGAVLMVTLCCAVCPFVVMGFGTAKGTGATGMAVSSYSAVGSGPGGGDGLNMIKFAQLPFNVCVVCWCCCNLKTCCLVFV